ncbi:three-helix bundle dimerization domain-containing protein [Microbacterium xanthum]|uniref:three-helix bundle dimerization domain-containing protein n=1 Tax=Microbacterium xanthum TaxID=3079794 RepID=UPI002AD25DAB|nr:hypothetical protein [Microbacterium sp. KSW-48]MDZ8171959.1 hypothetical protein [Microbacterium sp. KSW-48]
MSEEPAAPPARDEDVAIDHAIDRLAERFPSVARTRVEQIVDEERRRLDGGRVRDFIPVLVEHEAKERLRREAVPAPLEDVMDGGGARRAESGGREDDPMERQRRGEHTGLLQGDAGGGR